MTIERIKTYVLFAALLFSVQAWSQRGEMDSLSKKAQTCYQNHDFVNAVIYQQQVVGLLREQERPIGLRFANANRSLALYVSKNGGSDAAITTIQSAIKIYDSIFTPCNEESLASRLELVLYLEKSCKYQEGLNIIREIDEIENCMEVVPEKYSIDALLKAASLYSIMSDYNKSLDICKEALIRSKNSFGENSEQYAQSLDLMSYIYYQRGDLYKALLLGKQSCAIFQNIPFSPYYLYALNDLASYYCDAGDLNNSVGIGLMVQKKALTECGAYDDFYINSLNSLACYFANAKRFEDAILYSQEALRICEEKGDFGSFSYARSLSHLASFYAECSDYGSAIACTQKSLPVFRSLFGQYSPEYNDVLRDVARYYYNSGDTIQAQQFVIEVENNIEEAIINSFSVLSSRERALFLNWYNEWYYYTLPFYCVKIHSEEMNSLVYNSILFSKGLLLNTDIEERRLLKEKEGVSLMNTFHQLEKMTRLQESLLIQHNGITVEQDSIGRIIDSLRNELAEKSVFLKKKISDQRINWENVRQSLNDKEIAIEFFKVGNGNNTDYYALSIKKDYSSPHLTALFSNNDFSKIKKESYFRESLLGELIWGNLSKELDGVEEVFFSPTGVLQNIGIEYLSLNSSHCFSDLFSVHRLTSTRELLKRIVTPYFSRAVLYGGLDYNHKTDSAKDINAREAQELPHQLHRGILERGDFQTIPASLDEVIEIEKSLRLSSIECDVYTDSAGSEKSFRSLSGSSINIIHLATHGDFIPIANTKPNNVISNIDTTEMLAIKNYMEDYAMTRSFIVFSGANALLDSTVKTLPNSENDGIVTAYDISGMDFDSLDLVVLSACNTGLGELSEDGVIGLQRGFKKAGARSMIMSLWKVADEPTMFLMTCFYQFLSEGEGIKCAFSKAQSMLKQQYGTAGERPYWASFILLDAF